MRSSRRRSLCSAYRSRAQRAGKRLFDFSRIGGNTCTNRQLVGFFFFTKPISLWKNKENNTLVLSTISCTYYIIRFLRREMLDFTAFPVFFVSNLLLVQRKKYYFNRATVSRNCSIVL